MTNGLEVFYIRKLNNYLNFALPAKAGVARFPGEINNKTFVSADLLLQLKFAGDAGRKVIPYLMAGGGISVEEFENSNVQIPVGLGVNIAIGTGSYINLQGEYRFSQDDNRNNIQAGIGYIYQLGRRQLDTDKDGIPDIEDQCPEEMGSPDLAGCPDRDGDGIADKTDSCPDVAGPIATNGCPDRDGDGVIDEEDECPDVAGTAQTGGCPDQDNDGFADGEDDCPTEPGKINGCPDDDNDGVPNHKDACPYEAGPGTSDGCPPKDTDGDGVPDSQDDCPEEAGSAASNGCPDQDGDGVPDREDNCPSVPGEFNGCPDTDGDGLDDSVDKCPTEAGTVENNGCPPIQQQDQETLQTAMQAVQFETGKATLKAQSYTILDKIVDIMVRYPSYKLRISGHTDDVGNDQSNQKLSQERARSTYEYIISKGINASRVSHAGYGETKPIADNRTREGRTLNRRVEFDLYVEQNSS